MVNMENGPTSGRNKNSESSSAKGKTKRQGKKRAAKNKEQD